jgi:hypothetical protein
MPFKSKAQIAAEEEKLSATIQPGTSGNEPSTVKKDKKNDAAEGVKQIKQIYAQKEELEEKEKEIEELKKELEFAKAQGPSKAVAPDNTTIDQLKSQIDFLSRQVATQGHGSKLMFRPPTSADVQEDTVTFTARSIIYIVASYKDARGIEKLPPHKLIIFEYAASDIKKDGKEDTIKNFSQYTTNLKTEIEFLRAHPYYNITFGENVNEMMAEDTKETEFKLRAANMLATMTPETIFDRAKALNIPNWRSKSSDELRMVLNKHMADTFKKEAKELQDDILKRQILAQQLINEEK